MTMTLRAWSTSRIGMPDTPDSPEGAAFVVGADEFSVTSSIVPAADFTALVEAAVRRVIGGR